MCNLLILFGSFREHNTYAQKYNIKTYSVNDGLPSSSVYDLQTDKDGYLWMATPYGFVKYDGKNFEVFGTNQGLKDDLLFDFLIDDDGKYWVSTEFGGVARFSDNNFEYLPELALLDTMVVNYMITNKFDEMWFATDQHGVVIWDKKTNELSFINDQNGLPHNLVWDIHFITDTEVWITTMWGILVYDKELGVVETFTSEEDFEDNAMYEIAIDLENRKWVATSDGIFIISPDGTIDHIKEVNGTALDYVYTIEADNEGTIWAGTERNGLVLFEPNGNTIHVKRKNGLSSNFIYRIIKDIDGSMWVATDGNGVNLFKDRDFLRYNVDSDLQTSTVTSLHQSKNDGTIWIGTDKGLSSLKNGKFTNYEIPEDLFDSDEIWDIEELPNGDLLLLTYNYEFFQFNGSSFFNPQVYDDLIEEYVNDIHIDEEGVIWFAAYGQLIKLENGELSFIETPVDDYWQSSLYGIFEDSRGIKWLTTEGGVAIFKDGEFEYFSDENGIPGYNVFDIVEDNDNNLWVATDAGIVTLSDEDIRNEQYMFSSFLETELEIDETVFLHIDTHNGLWQGTNAGLYYFDLNKVDENIATNVLHFPLTDNGIKVELNGGTKLEEENGNLWFGTYSHGLISFSYPDAKNTIEASDPPKIFLREIIADQTTIYDQFENIGELDALTIPYEMNDITFRFNAIDYQNPDEISFRYKLDGYDNSWNEGEDHSEIRYTNIPSGNYNLLFQVKSIKSEWSETIELVNVHVQKPFYLSLPFFFAVAIIIGLIVYAYINSRIGKIEKRELQKLVDQQTSDLTIALSEKEVLIKEIHHRVKNNMAVVSGLLELQGFRLPAGAAKMAIQESKMRVIAMSKIHENLYQNDDLANVNFRKFTHELVHSIQSTMDISDKNIEVVQHIDNVMVDVNIGIPLGLVTNELISNCYKHAFEGKNEGEITIRFEDLDQTYKLTVSDNGIGTTSAILDRKQKSLGVTLIKSLTSQVSGYMEYSNKVGSTFTLTLPKDQSS